MRNYFNLLRRRGALSAFIWLIFLTQILIFAASYSKASSDLLSSDKQYTIERQQMQVTLYKDHSARVKKIIDYKGIGNGPIINVQSDRLNNITDLKLVNGHKSNDFDLINQKGNYEITKSKNSNGEIYSLKAYLPFSSAKVTRAVVTYKVKNVLNGKQIAWEPQGSHNDVPMKAYQVKVINNSGVPVRLNTKDHFNVGGQKTFNYQIKPFAQHDYVRLYSGFIYHSPIRLAYYFLSNKLVMSKIALV